MTRRRAEKPKIKAISGSISDRRALVILEVEVGATSRGTRRWRLLFPLVYPTLFQNLIDRCKIPQIHPRPQPWPFPCSYVAHALLASQADLLPDRSPQRPSYETMANPHSDSTTLPLLHASPKKNKRSSKNSNAAQRAHSALLKSTSRHKLMLARRSGSTEVARNFTRIRRRA